MKGYDAEGLTGPRKPLPDTVTIAEPPVDKIVSEPSSESRGAPDAPAIPPVAPAVVEEPAYQADFQRENFAAEQPPSF